MVSLKRIKKESFKQFCEGLSKNTNPKYLWNTIKGFQNRWNYKENANEYDRDKIKAVKDMIGELCPSWVPNSRPRLVSDIADPFLDSTFTKEELIFALPDVKLSSNPGLDGIDYKMIFQLPDEAKLLLLELFNQIFSPQEFLLQWSRYAIFFIPKSEKNKFRPISLAPCLAQVMEKLLNNRISWWFEH